MEIDRLRDADNPPAAMEANRATADKITLDTDTDTDTGTDEHGDGDRAAACIEYRAIVDATYQAVARERWENAKPAFSAEWAEHKRQHPAPADVSPAIDEPARRQVEAGCTSIRETEETTVTPAMHRIESADPDRQLTGLEHRRKGEDRIMEKVARQLASQPDLTPDDALASVKDAIRYTFQYTEDRYTEGVESDVDRLKAAGFEQVELRNSWEHEEYKGINSRWRVPENGQLFEVQFHTGISFEAKQLTHPAYERLRNPLTPKGERDELRDFQRQVCTYIPIPPDATNTPDYM